MVNELISTKHRTIGETIKLGVGLVVGIAADVAVTALLKEHIPISNGITKILTKIGVFAIGMKVGEDAQNYFYKVCDDTKESIEQARLEAKNAVAEIIEQQKDEGGH